MRTFNEFGVKLELSKRAQYDREKIDNLYKRYKDEDERDSDAERDEGD